MSARPLRAAAHATDPRVLEAARAALVRGHATDAVVAGVFAAAALSPSVLLGPVQLLVGGAGAGLHAVDGRVQQPGKGLARPRGFQASDDIPAAARVGAPALPAALSSALASFGGAPLAHALGPAIEIARKLSKPRAALLKRIAERGPRAITEARVADLLVLAAGRGQGGLLSERDLEELRPVVVRAEASPAGQDRRLFTVPWGAMAVRGGKPGVDARATRVVLAADARGQMAIACYEVADEGVRIEALDLVAPLLASPVLRGRTRVPSGMPCAAAAPIALRQDDGVLALCVGAAASIEAEERLCAWLESTALVPEGILAVERAGRGLRVLGATEA